MLDDEAAQDLWWEAKGVVNIYNWVESGFALNLPNVLFRATGGKIKTPTSGSRMLFKGEGIGIESSDGGRAQNGTGRGLIFSLKGVATPQMSGCCCCCCCCYEVASVVSDSVRPHRRQPTRLPHPWDSPGKNTGVGCHFLLQCMRVKSESEVAQS